MWEIDQLERALAAAASQVLGRPWIADQAIDDANLKLEQQLRSGAAWQQPQDRVLRMLEQFGNTRQLETLEQARLVCFGVGTPFGNGDRRVIEDGALFKTLLSGVSEYRGEARKYRRCYQGLLANWFGYDPEAADAPQVGRDNWQRLRMHLEDGLEFIASVSHRDPDWVTCLRAQRGILSEDPCGSYAPAVLEGDDSEVEGVRRDLGIERSSWFLRWLLKSMIASAIARDDEAFAGFLGRLLPKVLENPLVQDEGLADILNRYARIPGAQVHADLRDAAVRVWGNPWLPSHEMSWRRASGVAREMVADWLKLEFIHTFFSLLTEQRTGDRRRLRFWSRYVHAIEDVHFALGADAQSSRSEDFVALREKMKGLSVSLVDQPHNNAFIMRMGAVTIVEFGSEGHACYAYDSKRALPFDVTSPVSTAVGGWNSLKQARHAFRLLHKDNVRGYKRWEGRFEEELRRFGAEPSAGSLRSPRAPSTAPPAAGARTWADIPYSWEALTAMSARFNVPVRDLRDRNGNLWVVADKSVVEISDALTHWGFTYKDGKGWWK